MAVTISGSTPTFSVATGYAGGTVTNGTAVASTSGTSIDFTGIPSWVKRITVMFSGVSTNGSSTPWLIRLGTSGGIETTGYASSSSAVSSAGYSSTSSTAGFALNIDNSASATCSGIITLGLVSSASNTWSSSGVIAQTDRSYVTMSGGTKSISGVLTTVRITTTNGTDTFDAGTINILYE